MNTFSNPLLETSRTEQRTQEQPAPDRRVFPPDFRWGAATAAYQIEGAASADGRGESIWDRFSHTPGKTIHGDTGDVACDHYHLFRADVDRMRELGLKSYRFSIAWPRVAPDGGAPTNAAGLGFYSRLVDALLEAGITPMPTLYHWDLPQALEDAGGWANADTAPRFADYADACFAALGDRVTDWITLNEPWCSAHLGYVSGDHAPGHKDIGLGLRAGHTLLVAHGLAVQRFRARRRDGAIGLTVNLGPSHPATESAEDVAAARRWDAYMNRWFLDPVHRSDYPMEMREAFGDALPAFTDEERDTVTSPIDFIGVNYYTRAVMRHDPDSAFVQLGWADVPDAPRTAMGWEVYPKGLYETLTWLRDAYDNPLVYITENGAAYDDALAPDGGCHDPERTAYLHAHFLAAHDAIRDGVRLGGYYVWSLMDNFEWAYGYTKRFGIIHVDYATQARTPKDSAIWYAGVIRAHGPAG